MERETPFKLSRFTHFYPLEEKEYEAVYNSLNLTLLFLPLELAEGMKAFKKDKEFNNPSTGLWEDGDEFKKAVQQMKEWQMLIPSDNNELSILQQLRERLTQQPIGVLYMLLTDRCNFACRYCFIEGGFTNEDHQRSSMTPDIAKQSIDLFARALKKDLDWTLIKPRIIFYGGEPLLNPDVLQFTLEYVRTQQEKKELPDGTDLVLNTNASLITPQTAQILKDHNVGVSVSLDGIQSLHNANRIYPSGKGTFEETMAGFDTLKRFAVPTSLSCTVTWDSIGQLKESLQWFVKELGIRSLGFNIQRSSNNIKVASPLDFAQRASGEIIDCFKLAREMGVYEDRIMRKVNAFINGQIYFSDCAGCGYQIVVAPTGEVGVCHGLWGSRDYFVKYDEAFNPYTHPYWTEWRQRSPISMEQCVDCMVLGICGGGCPQQAFQKHGTIWELDEDFCIHAKMTLEFLIKDLFEKIQKRRQVD